MNRLWRHQASASPQQQLHPTPGGGDTTTRHIILKTVFPVYPVTKIYHDKWHDESFFFLTQLEGADGGTDKEVTGSTAALLHMGLLWLILSFQKPLEVFHLEAGCFGTHTFKQTSAKLARTVPFFSTEWSTVGIIGVDHKLLAKYCFSATGWLLESEF